MSIVAKLFRKRKPEPGFALWQRNPWTRAHIRGASGWEYVESGPTREAVRKLLVEHWEGALAVGRVVDFKVLPFDQTPTEATEPDLFNEVAG